MYTDKKCWAHFSKAIRLLWHAAASAIEIGHKNALASKHFYPDYIVRKHMRGFKNVLWRKNNDLCG